MEEKDINRTDRILNSLDGIRKAGAPDFFYTRLTGRMQEEIEPKRKPFFLLRPAFAAAALFIVLVINLFSLTRLKTDTEQGVAAKPDKPATIESFAKAYDMNTESVYE